MNRAPSPLESDRGLILPPKIEVYQVQHLPIVKAYADKMGLVEVINQLVSTEMAIDPGTIVLGMILDTLSGRSPLYRLEEFLVDGNQLCEMGHSSAHSRSQRGEVQRVVWRRHLPLKVEGIAPKAIHMRREVRTQAGQNLRLYDIAFLGELMQHLRLRIDIVKDHTIGDEMAVLDPFALEYPIVGGNEPLAPKEDPADEAIEGFTFVGSRLDRLAEVGITEIPQ